MHCGSIIQLPLNLALPSKWQITLLALTVVISVVLVLPGAVSAFLGMVEKTARGQHNLWYTGVLLEYFKGGGRLLCGHYAVVLR